MKKRILSILMTLCMVTSLFSGMGAAFADSTAQLIVSTQTAKAGDEVTLSVSTVNNPGVAVLTLGINYDADKLELVGFENSGFTGWTVKTSAVWVGDNDSTYNGEILKLKFKVLDGASGKTEVTLRCGDGDAYNYDEEPVSFEVVSGGVVIEKAHTHSYTEKVTAPTCTARGYTTHTCACGDSYIDSYTNPLGHDFGEWTVTTAPTCTEKGIETRYCSRCDASETREVKATGHDYKNGVCIVCGTKDPNYKPLVNPFVDVSESSVYYNAILWAYYHEPQQITGGYTATEFCPGNPCTRGQVVTFLWRAAGCPEPTGDTSMFNDASSIASPYRKAVAWAVENGITTGFADGTFRPNDSVTRAQFVTFLWRYENKPATSGSIAGFTDASSISGPYQQAVAWAVEKGITTGYNDGTFRPNATCTRWAVVLFMYRDMA